MKFDVRSDRGLIRAAGGSRRYVLISCAAPLIPPKPDRIPVNVAFVLDRSGSMEGERKIEIVRKAAEKAIGMLRPEDRFSVVVYDDRIDVLIESTVASDEAKHAVRQRLRSITARGSTDLGGGWLTGCEQAAMHLDDSVPAKCFLLTDGLANVGITRPGELTHHAGELRQRGVRTSTFGVGSDFDEVLLQRIADAGGGHSYYIEDAVQIPDFLTSELGETLEIVARDAALRFMVPAGVEARLLNRFRFEHSGESLRIELGDMVSGEEVSIVVELRFPVGNNGDILAAGVSMCDRDRVFDTVPVSLSWTFADHEANDRQPRDRAVDVAVAELYAANARDEALELNRRGHFSSAGAVMQRTAERIHKYAGDSRDLQNLANALLREAREYEERMTSSEMKSRYYAVQHTMRNRDAEGKSKGHRSSDHGAEES